MKSMKIYASPNIKRIVSREWMESGYYLVPVQLTTGNFSLALLLESEDDQRYKDVKKEKREHHDKANVIKSVTRAVVRDWASVYFCCSHGGLHSTVERKRNNSTLQY